MCVDLPITSPANLANLIGEAMCEAKERFQWSAEYQSAKRFDLEWSHHSKRFFVTPRKPRNYVGGWSVNPHTDNWVHIAEVPKSSVSLGLTGTD